MSEDITTPRQNMSRSTSVEALPGWSPSSWQNFPIKQQPEYKDKGRLAKALKKIQSLPPLVHPKEIETLKSRLADASLGKSFLLQGGDCAERFEDCSKNSIENKFKILLQMSLILLFSSRTPVVRIARLAGQYAKPRTSDFETVDGQKVYSYKGDNINGFAVEDREPNPDRLVESYFHASATLNYVRAMILGGVADLHNPRSWRLENVQEHSIRKEYESIIDKITDALDFLDTIHMGQEDALKSVELFTSHEGMLLNYEEALTLKGSKGQHYNCGAHFLWIGDRTRELTGAHIEYFRGISNPIGVKVGPSMKPEELQELVRVLNPKSELGRLTLITRYGHSQVEGILPLHIRAVKQTGIHVLWVSDPCHGNTEISKSGVKTRNVEKMMNELLFTFDVHRREGTILGGVHLELTGDNVTECIGGSSALDHAGLSANYETTCDPRLNYTQSLDVAFVIASKLKEMHRLKNLKPMDT